MGAIVFQTSYPLRLHTSQVLHWSNGWIKSKLQFNFEQSFLMPWCRWRQHTIEIKTFKLRNSQAMEYRAHRLKHLALQCWRNFMQHQMHMQIYKQMAFRQYLRSLAIMVAKLHLSWLKLFMSWINTFKLKQWFLWAVPFPSSWSVLYKVLVGTRDNYSIVIIKLHFVELDSLVQEHFILWILY